MKIHLIVWVLLPSILYATPHVCCAQTTRYHFVTLQSETVPDKTLKKASDVFNEQYVYEKSSAGNTSVYTPAAIKGKSVEGVLKSILYPKT